MNFFRKTILPILLATIWISLSEFFRNEILLKAYWQEHYADMDLVFPAEPINGAIWGVWSLLFAVGIFLLQKKFNVLQTTFLSWFFGFVLMWVVVGNLGVLPHGILLTAVPLSILEAFVATLILKRLS